MYLPICIDVLLDVAVYIIHVSQLPTSCVTYMYIWRVIVDL